MKKSNYCLMLSDGVVAAIDALAGREGTNRSALINRILAEYVSYVTPEMRAREIFDGVRDALSSAFRREAESETMLALCSSLAYRYNPTVRYSLELYRSSEALGEIRVTLRTKNPTLLSLLYRFFETFATVETRYIGPCEYTLADGRFSRVLRLRKNAEGAMLSLGGIGNLAAAYITVLDRAMKAYFRFVPHEQEAQAAVDAIYRAYLSEARALL